MHKKSWASRFLAVLILCLGLALPAAAAGSSVRDEYGLFDAAALSALEQTASTAADGHDCAVYYVTCANVGSQTAREYAKDYYRSHELGSGTQHSGVLFLVAMESRDYVTITYGSAVQAFSDARIQQIEQKVQPLLSDGENLKAADTFLEMCGDTLDYYARHGKPMPGGSGAGRIALVILLPLGIAGLVCGILCSQMRTARPKTEAAGYLSDEGLVLHRQVDLYTHTTRSQVYDPPQTETNSSSTVDSDGFGGSDGGKF